MRLINTTRIQKPFGACIPGMASKFIPNIPVRKLKGSMTVAMILMSFITSFMRLEMFVIYESMRPLDNSRYDSIASPIRST